MNKTEQMQAKVLSDAEIKAFNLGLLVASERVRRSINRLSPLSPDASALRRIEFDIMSKKRAANE